QAEDGIRDKLVTGVQTCALPIYRRAIDGVCSSRHGFFTCLCPYGPTAMGGTAAGDEEPLRQTLWRRASRTSPRGRGNAGAELREIGRASCRERVYNEVVDSPVKR